MHIAIRGGVQKRQNKINKVLWIYDYLFWVVIQDSFSLVGRGQEKLGQVMSLDQFTLGEVSFDSYVSKGPNQQCRGNIRFIERGDCDIQKEYSMYTHLKGWNGGKSIWTLGNMAKMCFINHLILDKRIWAMDELL